MYGCMHPLNTASDSNMQRAAIDERLEGLELSELQVACDGCNFYMQDAIIKQTALKNTDQMGGSRSQSGIRVYLFDNVNIDQAFYMVLDSNIFAQKMNRELKLSLMNAIKLKKKDFSKKESIDNIGFKEFSSLSYAKRLNNESSLPRAMLDSVETIESDEESSYSSNSLEGFIVDNQIVVLHVYSESLSWKRR